MKFWELHSVLHREGVRARDLPQDSRWDEIRRCWATDYQQLIHGQGRDLELDEDLVIEALELSQHTYSLDGNILRGGGPLSAVEVARRFGGSILEEVQEKGSQDVTTWPRR